MPASSTVDGHSLIYKKMGAAKQQLREHLEFIVRKYEETIGATMEHLEAEIYEVQSKKRLARTCKSMHSHKLTSPLFYRIVCLAILQRSTSGHPDPPALHDRAIPPGS